MLAAIRTLYAYNRWANDRVLAAAAPLDPPGFVAPMPDEPSIRDTLVHIASAQWLWRRRWLGESPMTAWHPADFPDLAALRRRWAQEETETAAFVAGLSEPGLDRVVAYRNQHGEPWAYPLWQQLLHQANHAQQHRSEAALLLTRAGCSPGPLDLLVYVDERGDPNAA
ncbi:MAG TPA: DinB family protein [Thermomicrobiales bacterium]|nr:DinB family protein [Thermomicrobiales bacterium]